MILHELLLLAFMSLIARAASVALSDVHPTAPITPTAIRIDDRPIETFIPSSTITLKSATTASAVAAAAAAAASNGTAFMPPPTPSNTAALGAIVPVGAVSATVAAIVFRMYRSRCDRERKKMEARKIPAELEAGMIPIELEAKEQR
ncbi:hypothetical protein K458DRAFT_387158 [Lentithecium fluviatile CBS 122367]|uniref:Uncharacterized protein n=1 Tax=Lentithecium fluviatile CBS 122367 TaxID=1168545 RepID=A0A6G1J7G5_9PLEO|nr:hypothetical protein K458DRAFT_387158 [Lentithecium fluviatile CBS 122367]